MYTCVFVFIFVLVFPLESLVFKENVTEIDVIIIISQK